MVYLWGGVIIMAGMMNMLLGSAGGVSLIISASTTNVNLLSTYTTEFGIPTSAVNLTVEVKSGVTIGATSGNTALTLGQFPSGSTITINNSGSIQGYGAAITGGVGAAGGDAINANYANQTVAINNLSGATVYAGGGSGGKGGTGGSGSVSGYTFAGTPAPNQSWGGTGNTNCNNTCNAYWAGSTCYGTCTGIATVTCTACGYYTTSYPSGGIGGNGGQGQGYGQANSMGSGGAAGGTNAGTGGTGGTGGTWGTGGNTGATGASGNYTAGTVGSGGGASGRYLVKGANSVTFNNLGGIAGALA